MSTSPSTSGLANKYIVLRRIGLNGNAELFLGKSASGGEQVVIKRLSPALANREDEVARFTMEGRIATALRHPNVVSTLDYGKDDAGWYLVLSAVPGQALRRVMDAWGKPFPLAQAFQIILEVSRALIYAHSVPDPRGAPGVLHRGISPVSILMGTDGVSRLLDFGVDRPQPRADDDARRVRYYSPEQVVGAPLDPRSDVYSLGAVLFELTTGRPLFTATSTIELLRSIADGDILSPSSIIPDYPVDLEELVIRALARDPAARFEHAGDLAAALEVFLVRNELTVTTEQMAAWVKPLIGAKPAEAPAKIAPTNGTATVRAEATAALKLAEEKQAAARKELEARRARKAAAEAPNETVPSLTMPPELMAELAGETAPDAAPENGAPPDAGPPPIPEGGFDIEIEVVAPPPKPAAKKPAASPFAPPPRAPSKNAPPAPIPMPSDTEPGTIPSPAAPAAASKAAAPSNPASSKPPASKPAASKPAAPGKPTASRSSETEPGVVLGTLPAPARPVAPPAAPTPAAASPGVEPELRKQLAASVEREAEAARKAEEGAEKVAQLEKQRAELQAKLAPLQKELAQAKARAESLARDLADARASEQSARGEASDGEEKFAALQSELEGAQQALETVRAQLEEARGETVALRQRAESAEALLETARQELLDRDASLDQRLAELEAQAAQKTQAEISQVEATTLRLVEAAKRETKAARGESEALRGENEALRAETQRLEAELAEARRQAEEWAAAADASARDAADARAQADAALADAAAKSQSESAAGQRAERAAKEAERARNEARATRKEAEDAKKAAEQARAELAQAREAVRAAQAAVAAAEERRRQLEAAEQEDAAKRKAEVAAAMQVVRTAMEEAAEARRDADAARAEAEAARVGAEAAKREAEASLAVATANRAEADRVLAEAAEIRAKADAVARAAAATRREANVAKADAERAVKEAEERRTAALQMAEQVRQAAELREESAKRAEQASFEMVQAAARSLEAAKAEAVVARADAQAAREEAAAARADVEALQREARAAKALADAAVLEAEQALERVEAVRRDRVLDAEIAELEAEEARWAAHAARMKALLADAPTGEELEAAFDGLVAGTDHANAGADAAPETAAFPGDEVPYGEVPATEESTLAGDLADEPAVDQGGAFEADSSASVPEEAAAPETPVEEVPAEEAPPVQEEALAEEAPTDEAAADELSGEGDATVDEGDGMGEPDAAEDGAVATAATDAADATVPEQPAPASVSSAGRSNLAADDEPFLGRTALLAAVDEALAGGARSVLLHGEPGVGRTRLLRQIGARRLLELSQEGGVWFVPLQHARTRADVCRAVAAALSLRLAPSLDGAVAQLTSSLGARKRLLLLLDDADGPSEALATLVPAWLAAAEGLTVVATAESAAALPDATAVEIGPLEGGGGTADASLWARVVHDRLHPEKSLSNTDATAVAALFAGHPLAIEVALGSSLPIPAITKALGPKLKGAPPGEVLPRVLEWRWSILEPWKKVTFAHASVFEGSFATDAAAAVIDLSSHPKAPPMEQILASLRAGGLLRIAGASRWEFHPAVGAFAATRLPAAPRAKVAARRDAFVAALGAELAPFAEARSEEVLQRLSEECVQLLACLHRALESPQGAKDALALLRALGPVLERQGASEEAMGWASAALEAANKAGIHDAATAAILRLRASHRIAKGQTKEAMADLEKAEALAANAGDATLVAMVRVDESRVLAMEPTRRKEARERLDAALGAAESTEDLRLQACVLAEIGSLARFAGMEVTRDAYERGLVCAEKAGDRALECELRARFGTLLAEAGLRAPARAHLSTALAFASELGDRATTARAAHVLGLLALEEGSAEPAEERLRLAVETWAEIGERREEALAWGDLATSLELQRRSDEARRSRAWAMSVLGELEDRPAESVQLAYLAASDALDGNAQAVRDAFASAKRGAGKGTESDIVELLHACAEVALSGAKGAARQKKAAAALKTAAKDDEPLSLRVARVVAARALEPG